MSALEDYQRARQRPSGQAPSGPSASGARDILTLLAVLGLLCFLLLPLDRGDGRRRDRDEDHHEQVQPVDGGTLVLVSEKQAPSIDQDLVLRKLPEFCKSHGLDGYLWLDDDEAATEKLREYAKGKGVEPPLMAYVKDKHIKRVAKWAATGEAEVEKLLK